MGQEIVYCYKCQTRLMGSDFDKGKAFRVGSRGREIAQVDGRGAPAEIAPRDPVEAEMYVFDECVLRRNHAVGELRSVVVDTQHHRRAVLLSPDVDWDALTIYRYDKARFHMEFLFRDAKQFTGLCDSQARSQAKLDFHFNASLTAVTLATLEARQQYGDAMSSFSMASLKRRAFNQPLIDRICEH